MRPEASGAIGILYTSPSVVYDHTRFLRFPMRSYFVWHNDEWLGPFSPQELWRSWQAGELEGDCLCSDAQNGQELFLSNVIQRSLEPSQAALPVQGTQSSSAAQLVVAEVIPASAGTPPPFSQEKQIVAALQQERGTSPVFQNTLAAFVGLCIGGGLILWGWNSYTEYQKSAEEKASQQTAAKPKPTAEVIMNQFFSEQLSRQAQQIVDRIHPTATAKTFKLHEVRLHWRNGVRSGDLADVLQYEARATFYWSGWLKEDGFTKVRLVGDMEAERFVGSEILQTNGITNDQIGQFTLDFLEGFAAGYIQQAQ